MLKHNYLQEIYTTNGVEKQLKIPFEIELKIEKSDPVMSLSRYVEEMTMIGKFLKLSPTFPPLHTVRAAFTVHGVPS